RPPFLAASSWETIVQVTTAEPVPPRALRPNVPRDLETVCLRCLRKDPARRYCSAEELADDLQRFLNGEPVRARPVGLLERTAKWVRRRPAVAGLLLALVLVVVFGFAGMTELYLQAEDERTAAEKARDLAVEQRGKAEEARGEAVRERNDAITARRDAET